MLTCTLLLLAHLILPSEGDAVPRTEWTLLDFGDPIPWVAVNDDVMGGVSRSRLERSEGGHVFVGELSLENNGGFASVRFPVELEEAPPFDRFVLRLRGDGRTYQLRLRTDRNFDGIAYRAAFDTVAGEWHEVVLPTDSFRPTFRGRDVPDAPALATDRIRQIGLLVADGQAGPFRLEIAWLKAALGGSPGPTVD